MNNKTKPYRAVPNFVVEPWPTFETKIETLDARSAFFALRTHDGRRLQPLCSSERTAVTVTVPPVNWRVSDWVRLFNTINGDQRSVRNGWRPLHEGATWRRLAQGGSLLDYLHCPGLNRSRANFPWTIFSTAGKTQGLIRSIARALPSNEKEISYAFREQG